MGSTNVNLENKNEGKSSRRSFIRKWGLLSLGTIFAASQMTNKMPKVHAEVLDNAESNDISKDVIRMSKASASTDVFVSGQTAEDLANSVNGLSKSFSDALASLKNTAVAKAINAAGTTFTDVIASLATIADKSGFAKTLSAPEKVIIPAGYHDGTGFVNASALMKVPTQTLTLSAPTNGTDCINYAKVATSGLMQTPTANLDITSNGTFTVTNYKTVKVNVSTTLKGKPYYRKITKPENSYKATVQDYDIYFNGVGSSFTFSTNGGSDGKFFKTDTWSSGDGSVNVVFQQACQTSSHQTYGYSNRDVGSHFRSFIYASSYTMWIRYIPT